MRVGLTSGCFDLLHYGHIAYLKRSSYIPPEHSPPRKMTAEEIHEWKTGMDYVEREAPKAGSGSGTAADLHDALANSDGRLLPPL